MDKPKSLIFVSSSQPDDAIFASSHFEDEARKMDVFWTSSSLIVSAENAGLEIPSSDLLVVLQRSDASNLLKKYAPDWTGKSEIWNIPEGDNAHTLIAKSIGNLLIKLILQGGKRAPLAPVIPQKQSPPNSAGGKGNVRVMRESKGRKGKTVTVISGLGMDDGQLLDLAANLKQLCGTGGTVKDGKIEIQGDQCDRVLAALLEKGFKAKRAGG